MYFSVGFIIIFDGSKMCDFGENLSFLLFVRQIFESQLLILIIVLGYFSEEEENPAKLRPTHFFGYNKRNGREIPRAVNFFPILFLFYL